MDPKQFLREARDLARLSLTASLRELAHEAKNGLDRERVVRFADLASRADAFLSAEPPTAPKVGRPRSRHFPEARPKPKRRGRGRAKAGNQETRVLQLLREAAGNPIPYAAFGMPKGSVQRAMVAIRKKGHAVETDPASGTYRLAK